MDWVLYTWVRRVKANSRAGSPGLAELTCFVTAASAVLLLLLRELRAGGAVLGWAILIAVFPGCDSDCKGLQRGFKPSLNLFISLPHDRSVPKM